MESLRPLTLSSPPGWSQLSQDKAHLASLKARLEAYNKLQLKLDTITDEPTWNAFIPFGPLAYFPGQLVHTNDITQSLPSSLSEPSTSELSQSTPSDGTDWREGEGWKVLRSAKQAKESAGRSAAELEQECAELEAGIAKQERDVKKVQAAQAAGGGADENWTFNDRGEVINEEGLPMFDIREELPPESVPEAIEELEKEEKPEEVKPKMRYLIKKGGKQVVRPLNLPFPSTPSPVTLKPRPAISPAFQNPKGVPSATVNLDTKAILDELEKEEEAERKRVAKEEAASDVGASNPGPSAPAATAESLPSAPAVAPCTSAPKKPVAVSNPSSAATPTQTPTTTSSPPSKPIIASSPTPESAPTPTTNKPSEFLPSFSSGFFSRKPAASKPKSPVAEPSTSLAAPSSSTTPSLDSTSSTVHEPRHHHVSPVKSIYRPTPPSSAPSSRANSPRPDRRVAFDLPPGAQEPSTKEPKPKRAAIILPPPPDESDTGNDDVKVKEKAKEPFIRPIKDLVVERPIKPPSAPKPRSLLNKSAEQLLRTTGKPPKVAPTPFAPSAVPPSTSASDSISTSTSIPSTAATPIHTLSISSNPSTHPLASGHASIHELSPDDEDDEDDEPDPSLTSDAGDSSSDSSGFYGHSDDEDDDEEIDIDGALHAREVALAYHEQRMNLGAGAGTGPLGGDRDPAAFDSWNQPEVPIDATLQGRAPSSGRSSRFRTGRLESAQMIIPSLLASQVREDAEAESPDEEDDGLSKEERENIRRTLEALASYEGGPLPLPTTTAATVTTTAPRASSVEGAATAPVVTTTAEKAKAPPIVKSTAVPIAVPSNPRLEAPKPVEAPIERPKKMSRFKARQLGLEPET